MREVPRWVVGAPLYVAGYLGLVLLRTSSLQGRRSDIVGTLLLFSVSALVAWWGSRLIVADVPRRVLAAVLLVLWWGMFGSARLLVAPHLPAPLAHPWAFLAVWTAPFAGMLLLLRMSAAPARRTLSTVALASLLLIAFQALGVASALVTRPHEQVTTTSRRPEPRRADLPDIHLIVLDMFASPAVLNQYYDEDLSWFVDSLRSLGFTVPEHAKTNYIHTGLVLPALLNWRPVHQEMIEHGGSPWDYSQQLINEARAWEVLREAGYRLAFFPSGYPGTAHGNWADITFRYGDSPSTRFGETWLVNSPAELLRRIPCTAECASVSIFPMPVEGRAALLWKLDMMATLPDSSGPIASFLHFLGSHEPYMFNRDCTSREPWWPRVTNGSDSTKIRQAYVDQLHCVATRVLATVTKLVTSSQNPPVVLIQADHGNGSLRLVELDGREVAARKATQRQLHERLEVFAAYHVPNARPGVLDGATPVDLLPRILNHALGTQLPMPEARSYWSTWQDPLDLTEVRWDGDSVRLVPAGSQH